MQIAEGKSNVYQLRSPSLIRKAEQGLDIKDTAELCALLSEELRCNTMLRHKDIAAKTGLATSTISKIKYRETKLPRNSTLLALLLYFGYTMTVRKNK